jgi:isochorismate synthase
MAALGSAATIRVTDGRCAVEDAGERAIETGPVGRSRFTAVERARAWLLDGALFDKRAPGPGPLLMMGGFAFEAGSGDPEFPDALFRLPRVIVASNGSLASLTLSTLVPPGTTPRDRVGPLLEALREAPAQEDPPDAAPAGDVHIEAEPDPATWMRHVEIARRRIEAGTIEKVVLARRLRIRAAHPLDALAIHGRLAARFPSCIHFAFGHGPDAFVGATPELLVRKSGLRITSGSLAGTTARGRTPAEDRRLARALLESKKEQEEHAIVLRAIRETLAPFCAAVRSPEAPRLVRLDNVQHLHTPVTGTLRAPVSVLALAGALHPTPAVGGRPRAQALRAIRAIERFDRGWYAGPIGWIDAAGDGEFAVAIRSARIHGHEAHLFAGAGIVRDSDPPAELRETRAKLRALLDGMLDL